MSEMIGRPLAVVTGASSGIGRALAAQFAENGYFARDNELADEPDKGQPDKGQPDRSLLDSGR
ncbi:MAG TPA: hypothetical protein VFV73_06495 [Streptosporangiaceae bacterium]|nr:hypothetical protein [Streptosporangiaceae bacterium]